jgi:hypothetical protein
LRINIGPRLSLSSQGLQAAARKTAGIPGQTGSGPEAASFTGSVSIS